MVRVRDMSAAEVFARAEGQLAGWLREEGGSRLDVEIQGIGFVQDHLMWMTVDGEVRRVVPSFDLDRAGFAVDDLRERQVVAGWGAWTWCRLWMVAGEWVLHQECDWMREPVFEGAGGGRPGPGDCALELELYPRGAENVPGWMAEGVAANERRKAANARRREARRAKKERQAAQAQAAEAADQQGGDGSGQAPERDPGAGQTAQGGDGAGGSVG